MRLRLKRALAAVTVAVCVALASQGAPAAPRIPNPSFEESETEASGPRGWKFHGPEPAASSAWTGDEPFDAARALRIDAKHGTQAWQSQSVDVRAGQKYLLQWQTRFRGEKSWRFRADFCGVELRFDDAAGKELTRVRQHTNCWQTPGWRPAWFSFAAPEGAKTAVIRFAIETKTPLLGGFDVDAISLETDPPDLADHPDQRLVTLRIADETGRATAARIRIVDPQNQPVVPQGAISYALDGQSFHALEEGTCRFLASPGKYSVTVTRGFEYRPWAGELNVDRTNVELAIALEHSYDWHKRGWLCGDHHTHLFRHGGSLFPSVTWRDVMRAARSEGLDFLPFMGQQPHTPDLDVELAESLRDGLAVELTDEITEDFWGHVCPVGVSAQARSDPRYSAGPMNFDRDATFGERGGVLCYGHPYGPMDERRELYAIADPKFGLVAREFPIDLALGMRCGIDLLAMEGSQNQLDLKLRDLYRLYNMGFRPAITASTDFHVDQGRQPIGVVRTYVRAEKLDLPAIAVAYRNGRTFATNGPLVDLRVGDAGPGDEIRFADSDGHVTVSVEAVSIGRLDRVDIIVNGAIHETFAATDLEPHRIVGTCDVPARKSLWIAAKVVGPDDPYLAGALEGRPLGHGQIAHTSPVYVIVAGNPVRAARSTEAEYFVNWCDAASKAWRYYLTTTAAETQFDSIVAERIARARRVFEDYAKSLASAEKP